LVMRAVIVTEDGVDDIEALYAYYRLKEEGFKVLVAAARKYGKYLVISERGEPVPERRVLQTKHGIGLSVDITFSEALEMDWDALILPGGRGPDRARRYREAVELVKKLVNAGVPTAAICHGPQLLISAGVLRGRKVTGYWGIRDDLVNAGALYVDEDVVVDGNLVTARHTLYVAEWMREFVKLLRSKGV
jgi:protease I